MQPALIRTYEFLNYQSFDCPPARDQALAEVARAYEAALKTYNYRYLNRVVVISNGADNVSPEAEATIARHAEDSDRQGIYLAGIGVGEGLNDQLMNRFTDKGGGPTCSWTLPRLAADRFPRGTGLRAGGGFRRAFRNPVARPQAPVHGTRGKQSGWGRRAGFRPAPGGAGAEGPRRGEELLLWHAYEAVGTTDPLN